MNYTMKTKHGRNLKKKLTRIIERSDLEIACRHWGVLIDKFEYCRQIELYKFFDELEENRLKLLTTIESLLFLIDEFSDLPESAANWVTDPTFTIDYGVIRAQNTLNEAKKIIRDYNNENIQ